MGITTLNCFCPIFNDKIEEHQKNIKGIRNKDINKQLLRDKKHPARSGNQVFCKNNLEAFLI